jgi:hypothetical protein
MIMTTTMLTITTMGMIITTIMAITITGTATNTSD